MRWKGKPMGMWMLFHRSFESHLTTVLGLDAETAKAVLRRAKPRYRALIAGVPEFEKGDRFQMNLVNAAMVAAIVRELPEKPTVEALTDYYAQSMMTPAMRWFCRRSGQKTFAPEHIEDLRRTAALRAADRNPYSWNMELYPYPDGSGYEARFTKCGICQLMRREGLYDLTPALCHLDYTMTEAGETADFVRQYTLASGGPYCDCGYRKKSN